jgi:hypothetical protein
MGVVDVRSQGRNLEAPSLLIRLNAGFSAEGEIALLTLMEM